MTRVLTIAGCFVMSVVACMPVHAAGPCVETLAADLLKALQSRDERALRRIANNPEVFDARAVESLIGTSAHPFEGRADLKSAYSVLKGQRVLTKVTIADQLNGSRTIDVVYLPERTAGDFVQLAQLAAAGQAHPFKDYVMCNVVIRNDSAFMPHACYAGTDALD